MVSSHHQVLNLSAQTSQQRSVHKMPMCSFTDGEQGGALDNSDVVALQCAGCIFVS